MITQHRKKLVEEISTYVAADYKLLYLYTSEELKTMEILNEVARETETQMIYTYDAVKGLQCDNDKRLKYRKNEEKNDIYWALEYIENNIDKKSFVVFKDIHGLFSIDQKLARGFKNCINYTLLNHMPVNLFIISPIMYIPPEIEKEVVVLDIPLPSREEIKDMLNDFLNDIGFAGVSEGLKERLIEALNGLTEIEIANILKFCVQDGEINEEDIDTIISHKQQLIKKSGVLEFVKSQENIDSIGGLQRLKNWLEQKKKIFDHMEKAKKSGVDIPKGLLLFGMPGCGKSLSAKVIARHFEMPMLRLDMGMILGPYVGQSEENIRKAIKLAEATAPSVLWIDELEKAFAGIRGGGSSSSEISARIFGTILTWMQEKTKPVFVVATANSIKGMPPEFLRKGRFDEIFFVDFPKGDEIEQILKVHLKKRGKEHWIGKIDFGSIVKDIENRKFSGADIEALVKEVIEEAFIEGNDSISTEKFTNKLDSFKTIAETMKEEIEEMRNNAEKYGFTPAS
ncbi:MAG: AAA family ATPase [Thermodesulforhabdaceae bacterium]